MGVRLLRRAGTTKCAKGLRCLNCGFQFEADSEHAVAVAVCRYSKRTDFMRIGDMIPDAGAAVEISDSNHSHGLDTVRQSPKIKGCPGGLKRDVLCRYIQPPCKLLVDDRFYPPCFTIGHGAFKLIVTLGFSRIDMCAETASATEFPDHRSVQHVFRGMHWSDIFLTHVSSVIFFYCSFPTGPHCFSRLFPFLSAWSIGFFQTKQERGTQ